MMGATIEKIAASKERMETLRDLFNQIDRDASGALDREEVAEL